MKPLQVRILNMRAAAAALALTGVVTGACMQQSAGGPASGLSPVAPTPVAGNVASGDQRVLPARAGEVVCHARGNGTFALLSVNANAVSGHLGHGDGRPLGPAPEGSLVFSSTCELVASVASVAGTWIGESITFDPFFGPACGMDRNLYRLTLTQSGSDVSGEVYWKILESFYPPDVGMEQTAPLTSGHVSGNSFTFTYGPGSIAAGSATFTDTTMTGTLAFPGSDSCPTNTFEVDRQ